MMRCSLICVWPNRYRARDLQAAFAEVGDNVSEYEINEMLAEIGASPEQKAIALADFRKVMS